MMKKQIKGNPEITLLRFADTPYCGNEMIMCFLTSEFSFCLFCFARLIFLTCVNPFVVFSSQKEWPWSFPDPPVFLVF